MTFVMLLFSMWMPAAHGEDADEPTKFTKLSDIEYAKYEDGKLITDKLHYENLVKTIPAKIIDIDNESLSCYTTS